MLTAIRSRVGARLGLTTQADGQGGFSPSPVALKLATESTTDFDGGDHPDRRNDAGRILMLCTEQRHMAMSNGRKFSTGNHPVEMLVPMLHLEAAGFTIDVVTPTGAPAQIEMWAMPERDRAVQDIFARYRDAFERPGSLERLATDLPDESDHVAVFIPGGHGAMLGLPESTDVQALLRWSLRRELFLLTICHGPAALLAENLGEAPSSFAYADYRMAVFPDRMDQLTPLFGYMPGRMPWYFGRRLRGLGVEIVNARANGACHRDRRLITGDSPSAANAFGRLSAETLLADASRPATDTDET